MAHPDYDEQRDAKVATLAEQLMQEWSRKLECRDQRAVSDLHNTVLDYMTGDAARELFVLAATGRAIADMRFACMAHDAMYEACKADAERSVKFMEQRRTDSRNDNRIAEAELARALH